MRLIQFATAAEIALLLLGCSTSHDNTGTAIVSTPHIEVVHLPGIPPPVPVRVAHPGVAGEGCANNDGPAVELVFKVENELPTASFKDQGTTKLTLSFGPPLVGNQELHIRVNATLAEVKSLKQWTIGKPDTDGGLLAWVCPVGGHPCDFATSDTVTFTRANDEFIEGRANLLFQSGNTVVGRFSAKFTPRPERSGTFLCG
jgi:hypothetical protein